MMIGLIGASIPSLFANIVAFRLLDYYRINTKWAKPILISITVIGFGLTSYLISKTIHLGVVYTLITSKKDVKLEPLIIKKSKEFNFIILNSLITRPRIQYYNNISHIFICSI